MRSESKMLLNKRVVSLITPIILIGCLIAALLLFVIQKNSMKGLESERFDLVTAQLQDSFNSYNDYLNVFVSTITRNKIVAQFSMNDNQGYQESALDDGLNIDIYALPVQISDYISFAIFNRQNQVLYYTDNTGDPFSVAKPFQIEQVHESYIGANNVISYLQPPEFASVLISTELIDPRTLAKPIASQVENSLSLQVTVEPTHYQQKLNELIASYHAKIDYSHQRQEEPQNNLFKSIELLPDHYLNIRVPNQYMNDKLIQLAWSIFIVTILSASLILGVLMWLMRKYVIRPIEGLDHELSEVFSGKRKNISLLNSNDEIARLGNTIHSLHKRLRKNLKQEKQLAENDALTGLMNRRHFINLSKKTILNIESSQGTLHLFFIDLDNFKYVNDKYGHAAGDQLLKVFSAALLKILEDLNVQAAEPKEIYLSRLGGDEFVILVKGDDIQNSPQVLATSIINMFHKGFSSELDVFPVTASIGIANYPEHASTLDGLMVCADTAMYQAKNQGKNQFAFYSSDLAAEGQYLSEIQQQLHLVDMDEEFSLHYMPIYNRQEEVVGCEALLRWHSAMLGEISPTVFIPIAEASGQYSKIDRWVIEHALADFHNMQSKYGAYSRLSINLSSAELAEQDIYKTIVQAIKRHNISAELITFEMTETYDANKMKASNDLLTSLKGLGFHVAIDDFGSGYTSFMQMMTSVADEVKLDKCFIEQLDSMPGRQGLSALMALCHAKGYSVTAVGIEKQAMFDLLKEAGCDAFQGFYFQHPAPLDMLE